MDEAGIVLFDTISLRKLVELRWDGLLLLKLWARTNVGLVDPRVIDPAMNGREQEVVRLKCISLHVEAERVALI